MTIVIDFGSIAKVILYLFTFCIFLLVVCKIIDILAKLFEKVENYFKKEKMTKFDYFCWFFVFPLIFFLSLFALVYFTN